jgi:hypothetical protein
MFGQEQGVFSRPPLKYQLWCQFDPWHRCYSLNMRGLEAEQHLSALKDVQTSRGMSKTIPQAKEPVVLHACSFTQRMIYTEEYLHYNTEQKN